MSAPNKREDCDVNSLVSNLCAIILIKEDNLDYEKINEFIDGLTPEEKKYLKRKENSEKLKIRTIVLNNILQYINSYKEEQNQNSTHPFAFDSSSEFWQYRVNFEETYKKKNGGPSAPFPVLLEYILEYIQDVSEHYRIFGSFYALLVKETSESIAKEMREEVSKAKEEALEMLSKEIGDSVADAVDDAQDQASSAAVFAKEASDAASIAALKAETAAENAVKDKMHEVTDHVSTTSVTILGIFAGIVLTVVAGLIYSASVLESVCGANVHKLFIIALAVGFVCINILAVMFHYIMVIQQYKHMDNLPKVEPIAPADNVKKKQNASVSKAREISTDNNHEETGASADDNKNPDVPSETRETEDKIKGFENSSKSSNMLEGLKRHSFIIFIDIILIVMIAVAACTYKEPASEEKNTNTSTQESTECDTSTEKVFSTE